MRVNEKLQLISELHSELYEAHAELVNSEELQLLKEHEPVVTFTIIDAEEAGLSQGRQSRVSVLEYERAPERTVKSRIRVGLRILHADLGEE